MAHPPPAASIDTLRCETCERNFSSVHEQKKHLKTNKHVTRAVEMFLKRFKEENDAPSPQYGCDFCEYLASAVKELQLHYLNHHDEMWPGDFGPVCQFCDLPHWTYERLFLHEIQHIKIMGNFDDNVCPFCYTMSDSEHEWSKHVLSHTIYHHKKRIRKSVFNLDSKKSQSLTRFHCEVIGCKRAYNTKSDLNRHIKQNHTDGEKFSCATCNKTFSSRRQLTAHSITHKPHRPFSCGYCQYKAKNKCHLDRHMRIHAGSKPYSCPYCHYTSTTIGNLRKHVLTSKKHPGLPMYACDVKGCTAVGNTLAQLNEHALQTHNTKTVSTAKSSQMDWTEIAEGHPIIHAQRS